MTDIFISYASEDRDRIALIVGALEQEGWTVFWDRKTPVGMSWEEHIEQNLKQAACVVVVWSEVSIKKDWVKIEARNGLGRGCLAPVLIDVVEPPFGFDHVQFANLTGWTGDVAHAEWQGLIRAIERFVPRAPRTGSQPETTKSSPRELPPVDLSDYWQRLLRNPSASELQYLSDEVQALREAHPTEPNLIRIQRRIAQAFESAEQKEKPAHAKSSARWPIWAMAFVLGLALASIALNRYFQQPPPRKESSEQPAEKGPSVKPESDVIKAKPAHQPTPNVPLPVLVSIPEGCFSMGSPKGEAGRENNEGPQREVCLEGFRIGRREVTFDEYDAFVRAAWGSGFPLDNKGWGRGDRPVINVNWEEALAYTQWLSVQLESACSLPSEAQWEYAARAETTDRYALPAPAGSDDIAGQGLANCRGCGSKWDADRTAPVGSFKPNAWGIHDMHGNALEWVEDCWHDNYQNAPTDGAAWEEEDGGVCAYRVLRGGSWNYSLVDARSADRERYVSDSSGFFTGFRVVCSGPLGGH